MAHTNLFQAILGGAYIIKYMAVNSPYVNAHLKNCLYEMESILSVCTKLNTSRFPRRHQKNWHALKNFCTLRSSSFNF